MSDEQWFWCFVHNTVEPLEGCRAADRLGPYPDKETAARALEIAHERTAKQDKEAATISACVSVSQGSARFCCRPECACAFSVVNL